MPILYMPDCHGQAFAWYWKYVSVVQSELLQISFSDCAKVALSESRQMAALLGGFKIAFYMTNRLKAYFKYFTDLPTSTATANFERALTEFYALILGFLAGAIQTYQKSTTSRGFAAFWKVEDYQNFEAKCDKIGQRTEAEASNCTRELSAQELQYAKICKDKLSDVLTNLQKLQIIQSSIDVLHKKIDLSRLPIANGAAFDSYEEQHNPLCLQETRVELLQYIKTWVEGTDTSLIFWLNGMAGTGKSTISRTVAKYYHDSSNLGASFFFKRGEGDRGNATRFFTTLAAQLAQNVPALSRTVADVLDKSPEVTQKSMKEQFDRLVREPLSGAHCNLTQKDTLVLVIDALDECDREDDIRMILFLLEKAKVNMRLRLFITSRPELPIRLGFRQMANEVHHDVVLHEITKLTIEHDISIYLDCEFARIRKEQAARQPPHLLPFDWPGKENVQTLVNLAIPLFIFATTVCLFVADRRGNPRTRLDSVLKQPKIISLSQLDRTYLPILNQLLADQAKAYQEDCVGDFRDLVGPIVVLAEPLSAKSIASLLQIAQDDVFLRLDWFHSVLSVPEDENAPIRLLHLSFRDFLVDPNKRGKNQFWVDEPDMHNKIAKRCIELLSQPGRLKQDLCAKADAGVRRARVSQREIEAAITADVSYACRYWVYHMERSGKKFRDSGEVHVFLEEHFLHWMEALSWLGRLSESLSFVRTLQALTEVSRATYHDAVSTHILLRRNRVSSCQISCTMLAELCYRIDRSSTSPLSSYTHPR